MAAKFFVVFVLLLLGQSESARILAIMSTPSYSHQIVFNPLWLALNSRGHSITLFTTDPIKDANLSNFRQIDWSFAHQLWYKKHKATGSNPVKYLGQHADLMIDMITQELEHPQVQEIIRNENEDFDLVIAEFLTPIMMVFSERFSCPFIGVSPVDITNFAHEALGNPTSPALFPDFIAPFDSEMNFLERVGNLFYYVGIKLYFKYYLYPAMDTIVRKNFGEDAPTLEAMQRNASMVFLNINPAIHNVRPLASNVVVIGGGTHFETNTSLPQDIQTFLDEAESGAIYFSLGTNIKGLSDQTKRIFLEAFSELPYRVLWSFDDADATINSKILIRQQLPQQLILKHPNIKLFITHGSLRSLEEAIYNAIPIIAMPFRLEQFSNVRRATRKGLGLSLDYDQVEKQTLKETINEVINNEKYKNTAARLSALIKEQPISGLSQAVWWAEYVLKHRGAKFLKQPEVPLYQYLLLDVLATLLLLIAIFAYLWYRLLFLCIRLIKEKRKDRRKLE